MCIHTYTYTYTYIYVYSVFDLTWTLLLNKPGLVVVKHMLLIQCIIMWINLSDTFKYVHLPIIRPRCPSKFKLKSHDHIGWNYTSFWHNNFYVSLYSKQWKVNSHACTNSYYFPTIPTHHIIFLILILVPF